MGRRWGAIRIFTILLTVSYHGRTNHFQVLSIMICYFHFFHNQTAPKKGKRVKLVRSHEMQALDRSAIREYGIPSIILMENAGHNTFIFMENVLGKLAGKTVIFFIGTGNNGGDGLVVARKLYQAGGNPVLFSVKPLAELQGDSATNAVIVKRIGISSFTLSRSAGKKKFIDFILKQHANQPVVCLIDSLLGTGLDREVTGIFAETIDWINDLKKRFGWPVLAVDLPSGLKADTGRVLGTAVSADMTVTYGLAKPAHFLHGGERIGKLKIVDISIPKEAVKRLAPAGSVLNADTITLPKRGINSHKGTNGHLLVLAGSIGMTGAAILSCMAALRSGCGLVTAVVPHNLNLIFETALPEVMTIPLPGRADFLSMDDYPKIMEALAGKTAVVIGPGIGRDQKTDQLIKTLYLRISLPMVVDADALNIIAADPDFPLQPGGSRILTPHPGEMVRLSGLTIEEVQNDRIAAALNLSIKWYDKITDNGDKSHQKIITVLKGAGTVIAASNGKWAINDSGNPGMASGGMGDVLAGLIGGFLAQRHSPWKAACTAVYLHGLAADILADKTGCGFTPSEVAEQIPTARQKVTY
jgi:NAD(P)H-hydrate epimerase